MRAALLLLFASGCSSGGALTDGGHPPGEPPICEHYVSCVGATTPSALPQTLGTYGPSGTCWSSGASVADACTNACGAGLMQLRATSPNLALCGCKDGEPGCGSDGGARDGSGDGAGGSYPPGPYGIDVGSTLADFTAMGIASSGAPFMAIDIASLRGGACKCIVISEDAMAGTPSQLAQGRLATAQATLSPGLCIYEVVFWNTAPSAPTEADIRGWTNSYRQPFSVVALNPDAENALGGQPIGYPTYQVIDTATMKILAFENGLQADATGTFKRDCNL